MSDEKTVEYAWAENPSKLQRAIKEVEASGKKFTEEDVKKVYRRLLGRVIGEPARGSLPNNSADVEKAIEKAREEGRAEGANLDIDAIKKEAFEESRQDAIKEANGVTEEEKAAEEKAAEEKAAEEKAAEENK